MIFKNKKAIILDLDGTLVDSIPLWNEVDNRVIEHFHKVPRANVGNERSVFLSENTDGDIYEKYAQYLIDSYELENTSAKEVNEMRCDYSKSYHEQEMCFKEGADDFIHVAHDKGYKLLLASSTSKWVIDAYSNTNPNMKGTSIRELFDHILTREDVTLKKPNPEIYLLASKLSGFEKRKVIAIEDELVGVKSAVSAGIEVISMYDKYADIDRDYITALADYSFKDFPTLIKRL